MFALDEAMAEVVARATQPALAAIKLAWWRERLVELDQGLIPAEPRLQAASAELLSRGIAGQELSELEAGWAALLDPQPVAARVGDRGVQLFRLAARLLGVPFGEALDAAGRMYALADIARRGLGRPAVGAAAAPTITVPRRSRPLTALGALASRDLRSGAPFEAEATPARSWTILKHRLSGRLQVDSGSLAMDHFAAESP